jgi:hypothetical protein
VSFSLFRLVFRGFSELDVGLDDIARDMSWYCRSPLSGEGDVMAAAHLIELVFGYHQNHHTPNQRGIHRVMLELRVGIVHVHMRDVLSKPLVVVS